MILRTCGSKKVAKEAPIRTHLG